MTFKTAEEIAAQEGVDHANRVLSPLPLLLPGPHALGIHEIADLCGESPNMIRKNLSQWTGDTTFGSTVEGHCANAYVAASLSGRIAL